VNPVSGRRVRLAAAGAAVLWALSLPLASFAAGGRLAGSHGYPFAAVVYSVGALVCHQQAERSFELWGAQMPVCARCTGIYCGAALAMLLAGGVVGRTSVGPAPASLRWGLLVAAVPSALTLIHEWTTGETPANSIRALAGLPLGAAVACVLAWACARVEVGR
jgi:uncharacterized membrane protein